MRGRALLALQAAGGEVAVFGEAGDKFVRAGGARGRRCAEGETGRGSAARRTGGVTACCAQGGSAVLAYFLLHSSYFILSQRVVREGVARFAQGAGFHLLIRPVEHFADAAADEIGDGDLRGGMDVAG